MKGTALAISETVNISEINSSSTNIPNNFKLTDLLTKGGFNLIDFIFVLIGLLFFANLILAGWNYMLSQGDPKKAQVASSRIVNGMIGLIMAIAAYLIVRLISQVLGLGGNTSTPII